MLNHADVENFYSVHSIKWNYIVKRAAWWGGLCESRTSKNIKSSLRKVLIVITEIEGMINSRPITYVSSETEEPISLTPAHFIIGKRITSLPPIRLHLDSNLFQKMLN
ncbi:integrase catalytic domain-containing protein [Trichonephila inaurata madagascariensis]|uniref:Integrase catalytic domain-containing protein n=1 Tax=Trichonephila inaurata madagascariensis TaxID=2747483 RepID=A0A8X7BV47_9ARAC|nr:integrase catalytic domain-containing protein [Trichonephila inaurata madagascariensis]